MSFAHLARPARLAGSVWELARSALLLAAAARLAGGDAARLSPLLVPLAAPGLVVAAGFAASALLAEARATFAPLLRLAKLLEAASAASALAAALVLGPPPGVPLAAALAAVAFVDAIFFVLLLSSDARTAESRPAERSAL